MSGWQIGVREKKSLLVFFPEAFFYEEVAGGFHAFADVFDHLRVSTGVDAGFLGVDTELFEVVLNKQVDSAFGAGPCSVSLFGGA
jgi:hypothetical protein